MDLKYLKKATIARIKLNIQKLEHLEQLEHFLDCIFNNRFLQDVAYSVTNLKFDNGDCQKIAHVSYKVLIYHFILLGGLWKFWL